MNNYAITKCPKCKEVFIASDTGSIKVAGAKNLEDVVRRLEAGESLDEVSKDYCSHCLFPISSHATREEYEKHPDWLPYHEPEPQEGANRYV